MNFFHPFSDSENFRIFFQKFADFMTYRQQSAFSEGFREIPAIFHEDSAENGKFPEIWSPKSEKMARNCGDLFIEILRFERCKGM